MTCCWPSDSSRLQRKKAESPAVGALRPRAFAGAQSRPDRGRTRLLARRSPGKVAAATCAHRPPTAGLLLLSLPPWQSDATRPGQSCGSRSAAQPTERLFSEQFQGLGSQFSSSHTPLQSSRQWASIPRPPWFVFLSALLPALFRFQVPKSNPKTSALRNNLDPQSLFLGAANPEWTSATARFGCSAPYTPLPSPWGSSSRTLQGMGCPSKEVSFIRLPGQLFCCSSWHTM